MAMSRPGSKNRNPGVFLSYTLTMRTSLCLSVLLATCLGLSTPAIGQNPCDTAPVFLSGPTLVCTGSTSTYAVVETPGVDHYVWSIGNAVYPPNPDPFIELEWTGPMSAQLCVFAYCTDGSTTPMTCIDIEVYDIDVVDPEPRLVCAPDTFGANMPGEYSIHLITPEGCDSVITLTVALYPEGPVDLGTIYLCEDDHWELNGDLYSDPGSYSVEDYLPFSPWCLREMTFRIEPITDAMVTIKAIPSKQQKALPTLLPVGMPSGMMPDLTWTGPNGYWSNSKSIAPPEEGLYCLEVRYPFQSDPNLSCLFLYCVDVRYPIPPDSDEEPGGFDPDSRSAENPFIYPQPATDQFCIAWPGTSVTFGTYTLYNRWGVPVQSGLHDQVCTPLNDLLPDVYVLVLTLPDGSVWKTRLTIL